MDPHVGLGHARLSIIGLKGGGQPISNEDGTLWIVYNGEVFNYIELKEDLIKRGHKFTTQTDTEVIVHLYEELGPKCLEKMNGQFALAIWDTREEGAFPCKRQGWHSAAFLHQGKRKVHVCLGDQGHLHGSG